MFHLEPMEEEAQSMRQKFVNDSLTVVDEMVSGFVGAFPHHYEAHPETNALLYRGRRKNKVALVTGGGSGHEPLFAGFVGKGLADAAVCGDMFTAPSPESIYLTAKAVESGSGVVFLYGTFPGDVMNFDIAEEHLRAEGIPVGHIRVYDDITSAPEARKVERRGVAGDVFLLRLAGAACDAGMDIDSILRLADNVNNRTWTIGVALTHSWNEQSGSIRSVTDNMTPCIEYGIGLHGERGILRTELQPVDQLVEKMYSQLQNEANMRPGDEVCVLVNGLGSISVMELAIVFQKVKKCIEKDQIRIFDADFNNYCASYVSNGFSITLVHVTQEDKAFFQNTCYTPYYDHRPEQSGPYPVFKNIDSTVAALGEKPMEAISYKRSHQKLSELDGLSLRDMMLSMADKLIEKEAYLSELDSLIGDGDHGICIANGMRKIKQCLMGMTSERDSLPEDILNMVGRTMYLVGGASGTFFGSMYIAAADTVKNKERIGVSDFSKMWESAAATVQKKGGARVGDKTLIDALIPAVLALKNATDKDICTALRQAKEAAKQGMLETKKMSAKFGRGKFLSERAMGCQDAGATTIWLMFESMHEFIQSTQ